jgi:hypothetical protein
MFAPSVIAAVQCSDNRNMFLDKEAHCPTVAIEIDGVLCDYYESLYAELLREDPGLLARRSPNDVLLELAEGSLAEDSLLSRAARLAASRVPYFYHSLPCCPQVRGRQLASFDTRLKTEVVGYALAQRPDLRGTGSHLVRDARIATRDWLEMHGLKHFQGIISSPSQAYDTALLERLQVDFHFSASPSRVRSLRAKGICSYLFDRPWNHAVDSLWRVTSLDDFAELACEYMPGRRAAA